MNKCAYENRSKTQESLDYATNNPMVDKNEQRRKKEKKELEKWEKVKNKKPLKNYFLILLIVITVTYVVDELTSNINGTIKTDVIRFFYNIIGADVNSDEFNAASGNFFVLSLLLYSGVLLAPFYKSLADRFGRRIFLAINTLGMALGMIICMIAPNLVVYMLGSMIMLFVTPNDFHVMYIMEVSPAKHRNKIASITKVTENEPMKKHTTFRIGGPARYFAEPSSKAELKMLIKAAKEEGIKPIIIGRGSNLLVSDEGLDTLVISLGERFSEIRVSGNEIYSDAGASLSAIAQAALKNSLSGFAFASGIPGSLGGAVYMNAGAYGGEMKDVIVESTYLDEELNEKVCTEHDFSYRHSFYTDKNYVITGAKIRLAPGDSKLIGEEMATLAKKRREKQPVTMPSAGSVFKRPEGHFAGALIEGANLKGYSVGGAEVSTLHAGFIVNNGDATCKDVCDLIAHIKKTVYEKDGVMLETEIKKIG